MKKSRIPEETRSLPGYMEAACNPTGKPRGEKKPAKQEKSPEKKDVGQGRKPPEQKSSSYSGGSPMHLQGQAHRRERPMIMGQQQYYNHDPVRDAQARAQAHDFD